MIARFAFSLLAVATVAFAAPARAACSRGCDDDDLGGSVATEAVAHQPAAHHVAPTVEMTLPGYLWTKLRAEAHAYVDKAAFALITATSKLAVVAARERGEHGAHAPATAPPSPPDGGCTGTHAHA